MRAISRREFAAVVAAGVIGGRYTTSPAHGQHRSVNLPAAEIIERIRRNIGVDWREQTVDTIKAGDPATMVTGIVTTSNASIDVLRGAVAAGANFVVTSEPTFYGRGDSRTPVQRGAGGPQAAPPPDPRPDPIYDAKNQLIDSNRLVVMRLSDHWGIREPNGFEQGLADTVFGPGALPARSMPGVYDVPAVRLSEFASDVKQRLGSSGGIRVIGDPGIRVRKVALIPGTIAITAALQALPAADVLLTGEVREWESTEYARDVVFSRQPRALITVGRIVSEDPGMRLCAQWIQSLVPEVPVRHIAAGDPYWRPEP